MLIRKFLFVLLVFSLLSCKPNFKTTSHSPKENLISQIKYLINDPVLANAQIGIFIESISDNSVLFKQDEYKLFVPASNQKLYTTAVALEKLGADYKYETRFFTTGEIQDSSLNGDLFVVGRGDPSISGRFKEKDILAHFKDWADSLKAKGINTINGALIGNDTFFKGHKLGYGWNWDDEPYWYSAQIGALSFNENCIDLEITPGEKEGELIKVKTNPITDYVIIENNAITAAKDSLSTLSIGRARGKNRIEIKGRLPFASSLEKKSITIEKPALWFLDTFIKVLNEQGIEVKNGYKLNTARVDFETNKKALFTHFSPEMSELVKVVNKGSHNFYAEQVFKTLGAEIKKKGTAKESSKVIMDWLNSNAVTDAHAIIVDGSGLSRMNLVSPYSTATLLKEMYHSENFEPFYYSLPIAGVDGTLKRRMKNSVAQNVVRAKTGYVRYMRSLSGYTKDRSGNDYLFVIMLNYYSVPTAYVNKLQDKIAILLTEFNPQKN
ncbi:MAG: D-alanyl-D-alanine carboxypeptidase/D-alanyl-D-alanine-endopeptidase [Calditrichaeota bacterium]|nr:MAG: D-alanyl-D-alanine carboxypeptidase/D-alanyl-D-alanine-endopeptidase [Calditrichota bacterium]MBL1203849.1 D-alanyl-D-alanine carboxypeptidase/D-alanyl-D-alanine-endopeptidase [Calditrichota bacterium]NOG43681.1 D-alanyl-D-alanine carboxypeptidase/D-alanyl-D-alanine-endopeptidase [Calditrichota bacterium]